MTAFAIWKIICFAFPTSAAEEFPDSWALVRASNTGPNLALRFEATTKERLEEIQKEFLDKVNEFNK